MLRCRGAWVIVFFILFGPGASDLSARPRYRQNLKSHYGSGLAKALDGCGTCHRLQERRVDPLHPEAMPPHNPFGARLRELGQELRSGGKSWDLFARLRAAAQEDADGDGSANEVEILSGHAPGDPLDAPTAEEARAAAEKRRELGGMDSNYLWEPFLPVKRPAPPAVKNATWVRNPLDAFIASEHERRGLTARPEAPRAVLLRRVHLDLIGLPPRPAELRAFLEDSSPDAYEKVVDRLLASPRHGERWGRHWMDVWRYSDWAGWGNQVRDSQPHIWRWRDWIVESLNADKGYDRMVVEMLAGDELAPEDRDTLRATGYLARSFKLLSREAWMVEAVDHVNQAFLGITAGCARCHDHMYDPLSQKEYFGLRAIFEPYNVRLDRWPGQLDTAKDGLARAFDAAPDAKTFLYIRGDDRNPDKSAALPPGVPDALGGPAFELQPVPLSLTVRIPEKAPHVLEETLRASEQAVRDARSAFEAALLASVKAEKAAASLPAAAPEPEEAKARDAARAAQDAAELAELEPLLAAARHASLGATVRVEGLEDSGAREKDPEGWKKAATEAAAAQRWLALLEARKGVFTTRKALERARTASETARKAVESAAGEAKDRKKLEEAAKKALDELAAAEKKAAESETALAKAKDESLLPASPDYKKRELKAYPASSTGRRLAFARWIVHRKNPLAARVAANHIWLRHFGQGIVPSASDFGANGRPPSHPALLDWLASELMEPTLSPGAAPWSMKALHRLMVTSSAYRMASTPDPANAAVDPDNRWLWRMSSRRLEAETVRDAVLDVAGQLDPAMGGPELDQKLVLATRRRSIYYRHAAEKQPEFLQIFDMAGVSECYERKVSVIPQQALALLNSDLTLVQSRLLARELVKKAGPDPAALARLAFEEVLSRPATPAELESSVEFLRDQEALLAGKRERLTSGGGEAGDGKKPSADPALRARECLVHALMNHNDFVTVR